MSCCRAHSPEVLPVSCVLRLMRWVWSVEGLLRVLAMHVSDTPLHMQIRKVDSMASAISFSNPEHSPQSCLDLLHYRAAGPLAPVRVFFHLREVGLQFGSVCFPPLVSGFMRLPFLNRPGSVGVDRASLRVEDGFKEGRQVSSNVCRLGLASIFSQFGYDSLIKCA